MITVSRQFSESLLLLAANSGRDAGCDAGAELSVDEPSTCSTIRPGRWAIFFVIYKPSLSSILILSSVSSE